MNPVAALRTGWRRYLAVALAIGVGVAFLSASLIATASMDATFRRAGGGERLRYDAVVEVTTWPNTVTAEMIAKTPGVVEVHPALQAWAETQGGMPVLVNQTPRDASYLPVAPGGRMPGAGEVVVTEALARALDVGVGETVALRGQVSEGEGATPGELVTYRVTGLATSDASMSDATAWLGAEDIHALSGTTRHVAWYGVAAAPGVGAAELVVRVEEALTVSGSSGGGQAEPVGDSVEVLTGDAAADRMVQQHTGGGDVFGPMLLAFSAIAIFTSIIVIANTFSVLVAQRTRELALLRCVGGTRRQVQRSVLLEALVVAVVASVAAVLAGIATVHLVRRVGQAQDWGLPLSIVTVPLRAWWLPLAVGVVTTLLGAVLPAYRAGRVAPLAAMRPAAVESVMRASRRLVPGALLFLAGVGGMLWMAVGTDETGEARLLAAIAGGFVATSGLLLLSVAYVPVLIRLLGHIPARFGGATPELAVLNARRHPGRAASTATALLVGIGLMTMMATTTTSMRETVLGEINTSLPVDMLVSPPESADDTDAAELRATAGVAGVAMVAVDAVSLTPVGSPGQHCEVEMWGASTELAGVIRDPGLAERVTRVAASRQVTVGAPLAEQCGLTDGDQVTVSSSEAGSQRSAQRTVSVAGDLESLVLGEPLPGPAQRSLLVLRVADDADALAVLTDVQRVSGSDHVSGAVAERGEITRIMNQILAVVMGLLAASVLIALIGIFNTLSLSVHERTGESAILRALGLTRGQLRGMLAVEAVLLALVGALVGMTWGVFCAWVGLSAASAGQVASLRLAIPWGVVAGLLAMAAAAGLVASLVPARAAARTSPVEALSHA